MSTESLDLDNVRRRLERALEFVSEAAPDGVRDPHKTRRAAYILAVNDAPALVAEIERLRAELEAATAERDDALGQLDDAQCRLADLEADGTA